MQTENSDRVKRAEAAKLRSFKKYNCGNLVFVYRGPHLEPGGRSDNRDQCPDEDAGTDLKEYFVTNPLALDTDLVYLAQS
eukprot:6401031-Pyramimonas_sp.AAC.1